MSRRIQPSALAEMRDAVIIDIRLREERDLLGWIPGSLHRPHAEGTPFRVDEPSKRGTVVLACATGRRSLVLAERWSDPSVDVVDLEGGLQAWREEYPVCSLLDVPPGGSIDLDEFVRRIRSCFVVESVESGALEEREADPLAAVDAMFSDLTEEATLHDVWGRIDRLAQHAFEQGHRLKFIADHVNSFYVLAAQLNIGQPGWSR